MAQKPYLGHATPLPKSLLGFPAVSGWLARPLPLAPALLFADPPGLATKPLFTEMSPRGVPFFASVVSRVLPPFQGLFN